MPPTVNDEIIVEEPIEIQVLFKQVSEEAIDLRITEKFLAEVERRMLRTSTAVFNIEIIKTALYKLRNLPKDSSPMDFWQVDFQIKQEFQTWRNILQKRDSKIETYHLRRFCDTTQEPLDNVVYSALARFYHSLDYSAAHQSKFDLVMTRLFASDRGQSHRTVRLPRTELIEHLYQLFINWEGKNSFPAQISDKTSAIVEKIDEFIREASTLTSFEELIKSNLFERFRNFKQDLGKNYFEPAIVAAAVECNLAVGNAFNNLLGCANENLSSKLTSTFDFAGAFHDTSPNAQIHISEILNEVKIHETLDRESPEYEELRHIWELLEHIGVESEEFPIEIKEIPQAKETFDSKSSLPPQDRIKLLLATLAEPNADVKLLRDYMQKSETLKMWDLNDFLDFTDENSNELCRNALSLIIWSEEIRTHELNQPKNLPLTIRDEVKTILRKSQALSDHLQVLIEISDEAIQNRLLIVSNKLLETSLKLERAIVRFSNRNLGISKPTPAEEKAETPVVATPVPVQSVVVHTSVNRWLMAATLLTAIVSGSIYYVTQEVTNIVKTASDIEKINIKSMPNNQHLQAAFRKDSTLMVTAQNSWTTLSTEEQSATLQDYLNFPTKVKLERVVLLDQKGRHFGEISPDGISTLDNNELAEN